MFSPPPVPPWEGLHPLVVHFPIALLLISPLFVFLAAIFPRRGRCAAWTALILLLLGTAGAFVSVATGLAARDQIEDYTDDMQRVLDRHEDMTEMARNVFAGVTAAYALFLILSAVSKNLASAKFVVPANLVFVAVLMAANLLLANAAHLGGQLVHVYGVRAKLGVELPASAEAAKE